VRLLEREKAWLRLPEREKVWLRRLASPLVSSLLRQQ
jgi:hypothetical protein